MASSFARYRHCMMRSCKISRQYIFNAHINRFSSTLLPAGTYIVGDPGYQIRDHFDDSDGEKDAWRAFLEKWDEVSPGYVNASIFEFRGRLVCVSMTYNGDGVYEDIEGRSYGVDSGTIGALPIEICNPDTTKQDNSFSNCIEFDKDFDIKFDADSGDIMIGHVTIETGDWGSRAAFSRMQKRKRRELLTSEDGAKYQLYKKEELKQMCIDKGLKRSGNKKDLILRLLNQTAKSQ